MIPYNNVAVFTAPQTINIESKPLPDIPPDYVRIKYLYCGICGGDYSTFLGRRTRYPITLGHEFVGEIITAAGNALSAETINRIYASRIISNFFPTEALQIVRLFTPTT